MPLNEKGKKILTSIKKQYGSKKGKSVFYAMENSIDRGAWWATVHKKEQYKAICNNTDGSRVCHTE